MRPSTPRWWYRRRAPFWAVVLKPLSWLWAGVTAARLARGVPYRPSIPVICVGNLTVGGTGKTPVARELARRLGAHIVMRGHGGTEPGPVLVDPAAHTAGQVGDEALMLAQDLTVWVSRDRADGVRAAELAGARIVVMDDGHQNPSVAKTLSLVVVDGETREDEWPFGDGSVVPAGPLREPLEAGLARADAVVVILPAGVPAADPGLLALFGEKPVLVARLEPKAPPPAGPQLGFAGVGKPWKVERALKAAGCDLVGFEAFPDHARFSEARLRTLADAAEALQAGLVTTEKDWVRLPDAWRTRVTPWPVRAVFEDEAGLDHLLRRLE